MTTTIKPTTTTYRPLLDILTEGRTLPYGYDMWAMRSVWPDLTSSNGYRWPWPGNRADAPGPLLAHSSCCPRAVGDGLCVATTAVAMASGSIPAVTVLLTAIRTSDVIGDSGTGKLRIASALSIDVVFLRSYNLSGANLSYANLSGVNLCGANISDANLSGANLCGANISDADLSGANLCGANISDAHLSGANLSGADLSFADLSSADLSYADPSGANLRYANLSNADLCYTDTSSADLHGTVLSGIRGTKISNALSVQRPIGEFT